MNWLRASGGDVLLTLHIQPGAKKTEVAGPHGLALKIRLAAPPVDGKANEALITFLAERLGITKARLSLVSGQASRSKRVAVTAITAAEVEERLFPTAMAG